MLGHAEMVMVMLVVMVIMVTRQWAMTTCTLAQDVGHGRVDTGGSWASAEAESIGRFTLFGGSGSG